MRDTKLRIYCFKDMESWDLHEYLCHSLSRELSPQGRHYAIEHELRTSLTAEEFLERSIYESDTELLNVVVHLHMPVL